MRLRFTFLFIAIIFLVGCASQLPEGIDDDPSRDAFEDSGKDNIKELQKVEVREYQGKKFDSIDAFRENSIKGPQFVDMENYELEVSGLVEEPMSFTYDEVIDRQTYSKVITLYCVEGWDAEVLWEGILLKDFFSELKIKPEANTVIFYAYDGYSSSLPLDYILDNDIMLAHKMNGHPLIPERGFPFQLVAEEKWGYKWVKWITKIEISDDPEFKGYWESRGYSNDGDQDGPIFERRR